MNRREFLTGLLALGAAPAIVRAESLMKIWTPPQDIILPTLDITVPNMAAGESYVFSCYIKSATGEWNPVIQKITGSGTVKIPLDTKTPLIWGAQLDARGATNKGFDGVRMEVSNNGHLILDNNDTPMQRGARMGTTYARGY
jgi:hypothetical protein